MLPAVSTHQTPPDFWAHQQFQGARLGHCARTKRLVSYAQALAEQPGKAIPELLASKYDIEATYDLFKRPEATPDAIQAGHRRLVRGELRTPGRYLLFEDTTYVSFSHRRAIEGLGPIGKAERGQQGFLLHSILVARAPGLPQPDATGRRPALEVVGLADQQSLIRVPRPEGEPRKASTQRLYRERESRRWIDSGQRLGRAPGGESTRWVRVADREADIYEYLISCQDLGHGFLVRMSQGRVALDPCDGRRLGTVFEHAAAAEPAGGLYLDLRARPGMAARRACLLISFGSVRARWRPGKAVAVAKPVDCWFVRVWEPEPPPGIEQLEWDLYADQPVESLEDALGVAMDYGSRYLIEEFHKGLKTGMNAESLQLETSHRLMAAIAVMSVVALRLLDLKELGRRLPEAAASVSGLDAEEREILGVAVGRGLTTVAEVLLAVGRLGGHMNRRGDGLPGWITLWRGMTKLRLLVDGARMAREIASKTQHT